MDIIDKVESKMKGLKNTHVFVFLDKETETNICLGEVTGCDEQHIWTYSDIINICGGLRMILKGFRYDLLLQGVIIKFYGINIEGKKCLRKPDIGFTFVDENQDKLIDQVYKIIND